MILWLSCNLTIYRQTPLALRDPEEGMILWSCDLTIYRQTLLALRDPEGIMILWSCNLVILPRGRWGRIWQVSQ